MHKTVQIHDQNCVCTKAELYGTYIHTHRLCSQNHESIGKYKAETLISEGEKKEIQFIWDLSSVIMNRTKIAELKKLNTQINYVSSEQRTL